MQTRTARAIEDIRNVPGLGTDDAWAHARDFLEAAPRDRFADHLRWLEEDGRPVACVQVFLHQYRIGEARLGLCLPEYPFVPPELRGRGYFKGLMADLFDWMASNGYPLAYDHGRKGLYTGIGFAPGFHHCVVLLRAADALRLLPPDAAEELPPERARAHVRAFRSVFPLGRGWQCRDEAWAPPAGLVRVVPRADGPGLRGFVVIGHPDRRAPSGGPDVLTVTDSRADDIGAAAALLHAAGVEADRAGASWLKLNCRREDPIARMAVLAGGQLRWSAAQERRSAPDGAEDVDAFYLADLRLALQQLLPELKVRRSAHPGYAPDAVTLSMGSQSATLDVADGVALAAGAEPGAPVVQMPPKAMTQAVLGYATAQELSLLHDGCRVPSECAELMEALFPATEPSLPHEETAFAAPDRFGLVP